MTDVIRGRGRPSSYKPEYAKQAEKLCRLSATDPELADFFEVSVATIHRWKHDHEEFCDALKVGKDAADHRVERSLYQRAVGYRRDAVKIFMPSGAEEPVYAPYIEEVSPDVTAQIFWLKNRKKAEWRDKVETGLTDTEGNDVELSDREIARALLFSLAKATREQG